MDATKFLKRWLSLILTLRVLDFFDHLDQYCRYRTRVISDSVEGREGFEVLASERFEVVATEEVNHRIRADVVDDVKQGLVIEIAVTCGTNGV